MAPVRPVRAALAVALATPVLVLASAPQSAAAGSTAYLVVGVPGVTVDVLIDGDLVRSGLAAKSVVGPLDVADGPHRVTFRSDEWTVSKRFTAHSSEDLVVHQPATPTGRPVVTAYRNDLSPIAAGKARVTIAHTAIVPPADIRASGKVLFSNIANGEFVTAEVPPSTYSVDIVATGGSDPVFGPVDVTLKPRALTRVFAIGNPSEGTMDAIVQVFPLQPASVDSGFGTPRSTSTGDRPSSLPTQAGLVLLVLACLVAVSKPVLRHVAPVHRAGPRHRRG